MKFSLIHCYTDKNKGDAAIIIATTQLIRDVDKNADISMFSTYGSNDDRLKTDHEIIKKYSDRMFPALFCEPQVPFGMKNDKLRVLTFIWILVKSLLALISTSSFFLNCFLKKEEIESINAFVGSDVIISKGGSFLCTENNSIRQTLSLIRMLYPFVLARRYKKKIIIFSQSLGPVNGKFNNWLFKVVVSRVDAIYLRESLCLEKYSVVRDVCEKSQCEIIPDSAFFLRSDDDETPVDIDAAQFNVGFTVVDHDFKYVDTEEEVLNKVNNYKESIIESIKYLIDSENAIIHIFPQVRVDISFSGHNDMKISSAIKEYFNHTKYEKNVNFYDEDWTPVELRNLYKKMDIFIGTRLHSVIFSLSVKTPSINIGYHGTKSQGILNGIDGYGKYVLDINTITKVILINKIQELLQNKQNIKKVLEVDIPIIKKQLLTAMKGICRN